MAKYYTSKWPTGPSYVKTMNPTDEQILEVSESNGFLEFVVSGPFKYIREYGSGADIYKLISDNTGKGYVLENSSGQCSFHDNLNEFWYRGEWDVRPLYLPE